MNMYGFDGVWRGNYFRGEPISRMEFKVRVGELKIGKATGKDEVTGEIIKVRGNRVVYWILRVVLCWKTRNML